MEIISIEELEPGDKVVIQTDVNSVDILTVQEVYPDDNLIIFKEMTPLDYAPEDPSQIIVLSSE